MAVTWNSRPSASNLSASSLFCSLARLSAFSTTWMSTVRLLEEMHVNKWLSYRHVGYMSWLRLNNRSSVCFERKTMMSYQFEIGQVHSWHSMESNCHAQLHWQINLETLLGNPPNIKSHSGCQGHLIQEVLIAEASTLVSWTNIFDYFSRSNDLQ